MNEPTAVDLAEAEALREVVGRAAHFLALKPRKKLSGAYAQRLLAVADAARDYAAKGDEAWAAEMAELVEALMGAECSSDCASRAGASVAFGPCSCARGRALAARGFVEGPAAGEWRRG